MRYTEILKEFGTREFPGFGNRLFRRQAYEWFASHISRVEDEVVKQHLAEWFAGIFAKDNPAFKPEPFIKAAMEPYFRANGTPVLQSRHFYYLATMIHNVADEHMREFLTDWSGQMMRSVNSDFKPERWRHFCMTGQNPVEKRQRRRY